MMEKSWFINILKRKKMQQKISDICDGMKELLLAKNQKYGNSALSPNNIFSKLNAENSICIRLDDKIGRVKNSNGLRVNDLSDIAGYLVLLMISMKVSKDDILKLID